MNAPTTSIGLFVILGVVLVPLYVMLTGWFLGKPRDMRTALLGTGYIVGLVAVVFAAVWVLGFVLSFVVGY